MAVQVQCCYAISLLTMVHGVSKYMTSLGLDLLHAKAYEYVLHIQVVYRKPYYGGV